MLENEAANLRVLAQSLQGPDYEQLTELLASGRKICLLSAQLSATLLPYAAYELRRLGIELSMVLVLRTIHKIGYCYGYASRTAEEDSFALQILAAASANSLQEKAGALMAVWRPLMESAPGVSTRVMPWRVSGQSK